ncbi:NADH-quinone oxidoreductase subunit NuoK [Janibacter cremeus]|uniref:NADH-quinone oxidoreductase subunit NuoK n=1 Tax=Janibacter cremeus TaxID=1285192 RepID=UPI0023F923D6|nr:NADH-quinone oxidoreductase subunit NuoK [Janibacter cremeus]WEV77898.1 NADH-quinone oxidoreductase subunit NuoK [Janibacter cremeus]
MIHAAGPYLLASVLVGLGLYGILARRNAVLVLVGTELLIAGGSLLLVTAGALGRDEAWSGQVLTLFVITIAAAEVVIALAVIVAAYRRRGTIDLAEDAA